MLRHCRTTFSTVGYGNVAPQTQSALNSHARECALIGFVISIEAFIGILYAGFSGAILFTKLISMQSVAPVQFSEPICIELHQDGPSKEHPCPVVTFKIVNMLGNTNGGELVDASLNCFVVTRHTKIKPTKKLSMAVSDTPSIDDNRRFSLGSMGRTMSIRKSLKNSTRSSGNFESKSGRTDPKTVIQRTFQNANLRTDSHPFFELDWVVKHDLDENSPLLPRGLKEEIKENNGIWSKDKYNQQTIRAALNKFGKLVSSVLFCFHLIVKP